MTIRSRVVTDEYRREWERVFGKKEKCDCGDPRHWVAPLNPNDVDEHPSAD